MVKTNKLRRPVFAVSWDPRLPSINVVQQKHWRAMVALDPYLKEVFPQPPLVAYRRNPNIGALCIRAKLPKPNQIRLRRQMNGVRKCGKNCFICPYLKEGKQIRGKNFVWKINSEISCESQNIVYMISCEKTNCEQKEKVQQRYIGESERSLKERISEHLGYIRNKNQTYATGHHFNLPGHSKNDLKVTVLEKVKKNDIFYRKEREAYLIRKFNSFYKGLNRMP